MDNTKDFRKLVVRMLVVGGFIVLAIVLLMMMNAEKAEGATLDVPVPYPTITDAIIAANPTDTINVGAGTYNENLAINKSLTIQGAGFNVVTVNGDHVINQSNVYIDGFTFANSASYTITIDATLQPVSTVEITNCVFNL
ncbi:MAG: hypothetical protein JSW28_02795, partial [Thermoplasmata archaeon]